MFCNVGDQQSFPSQCLLSWWRNVCQSAADTASIHQLKILLFSSSTLKISKTPFSTCIRTRCTKGWESGHAIRDVLVSGDAEYSHVLPPQMVFYIEACESGSMMKTLPDNIDGELNFQWLEATDPSHTLSQSHVVCLFVLFSRRLSRLDWTVILF